MSLSVRIKHHCPNCSLDAAFEAPMGVTGLIGPSGSGKSTIINAIAGLLRPDESRIVLGKGALSDTTSGAWRPPRDRAVGYVFQDHRQFPHMNVAKNLDYGRWARGRPRDAARHDQVVELLGLGGLLDRRTAALSGGEKARVGIARALLSGPRLLLMDEPLAALDGDRKGEILPYLERIRDEAEIPIVYVSHALDEVIRLATTLVLMRDGKVIQSGPAEDILCNPASATTLGSAAIGALLPARLTGKSADGLSELSVSGGKLWVPQIEATTERLLRIRVPANDVLLSRERPTGLSALNILPATVARITEGLGPDKLVQLRVGNDFVLAQVTNRSANALELSEGATCFAILKSVAVSQNDISGR
jgi:molybdate transport system ATP-binding protein